MLVKLNVPICTKTTETPCILLWGMAFVNVSIFPISWGLVDEKPGFLEKPGFFPRNIEMIPM